MNNNWNTKKEKRLREWIEACKFYNKEHEKLKGILTLQINRLLISTILLSSLATIVSTITIATTNPFYAFNLIITSAIISAINTGLGVYKKAVNWEEKLEKHKNCANGYREIIFKIEQELALEPNDRINGNEFIKQISLEMLGMETETDTIPIKEIDKKIDNSSSSSDDEERHKKIVLQIDTGIPPHESEEKIEGLTPEQNNKFELFFKKNPSLKHEMIEFQMQRLESL